MTVRKASKDHGLRSEASARYEKGIDPNRTREAAERAVALMEEYAGGEVVSGSVEVNTLKVEAAVVTTTVEKINSVLGTSITAEEVKEIFTKLKFDVSEDNGRFTVTVPTRRGDITIEEDLCRGSSAFVRIRQHSNNLTSKCSNSWGINTVSSNAP